VAGASVAGLCRGSTQAGRSSLYAVAGLKAYLPSPARSRRRRNEPSRRLPRSSSSGSPRWRYELTEVRILDLLILSVRAGRDPSSRSSCRRPTSSRPCVSTWRPSTWTTRSGWVLLTTASSASSPPPRVRTSSFPRGAIGRRKAAETAGSPAPPGVLHRPNPLRPSLSPAQQPLRLEPLLGRRVSHCASPSDCPKSNILFARICW
jgi:hypothetical protein